MQPKPCAALRAHALKGPPDDEGSPLYATSAKTHLIIAVSIMVCHVLYLLEVSLSLTLILRLASVFLVVVHNTLNPKLEPLNPKPQTLKPKPSNVQFGGPR